MIRRRICIMLAALGLAGCAAPQARTDPAWTEPFPPFRIADNLYYVGSKGLANYLITTSQGHILINSGLDANVSLIRASVEQLGLEFSAVKILLINQAHWDHAAASATIKKLTGAKYMVMDGDAAVVESGGRTDFHYGGDPSMRYPPAAVDRVLRDGDRVTLGDAVVTARRTAGHTKGCTTWTMDAVAGGKTRKVVIIGGTAVNPGFRLAQNAQYPQIATDYERTFEVLRSLSPDIPLGAHGSYFDLEAKYQALIRGNETAFVDPEGYRAYVAAAERAFAEELARQKSR